MPRPSSTLRLTDLWNWSEADAAQRERRALLARWIARHGTPEALERWYDAPPSQGGPLAFAALVQQPGLLRRLSPTWASLLARDADDHAEALARATGEKRGTPTPGSVALEEVRNAIAAWRHGRPSPAPTLRAGLAVRPASPAGPAPAAGGPAQPGFEEAMAVVARLGGTGLGRLAFHDARLLAAAVTRHAGGLLRSGTLPAGAWGTTSGALISLQDHTARTGAALFLADGYRPWGARSAGQDAAVRSADMAVCGAAARLARGWEPAWRNWSVAEEAHAFAALALDAEAPAALQADARGRLLRASQRAVAKLARGGAGAARGGGRDLTELVRCLAARHGWAEGQPAG